MSPAEFECALPASERPKTHAVDRTATGIGRPKYRSNQPPFSNKPTNWTSLWPPLFHYQLRMHWNRKRSDFIECYLKHHYCTGVAQLALQGKKWSTFPVFFITKFVFETSKYQTAVKFAQMRKWKFLCKTNIRFIFSWHLGLFLFPKMLNYWPNFWQSHPQFFRYRQQTIPWIYCTISRGNVNDVLRNSF